VRSPHATTHAITHAIRRAGVGAGEAGVDLSRNRRVADIEIDVGEPDPDEAGDPDPGVNSG
jgi:hypothetical protein